MARERSGSTETRRGTRWVHSIVRGHVNGTHMAEIAREYVRLGAGAVWLVDASETLGYDPSAVREAAETFARLSREHGLTRIVLYLKGGGVRMGASAVAMSLRAIGSRLEIEMVDSREALERA